MYYDTLSIYFLGTDIALSCCAMGHELANNVRLPRPAVMAPEKPAEVVTATPVRESADAEALICRFKRQARVLELLESKLGPEGQALRDALANAQGILNELLEHQLKDDPR